jgi:HEAT repeat protein
MEDFKTKGYSGCARASKALAGAGRDAVPPLIRGLGHETPSVRRWSAATLAGIGPPACEAIPALIAGLSDDKAKDAMAKALGCMGDAALKPLLEVLKGPDPARRILAALALAGLGPKARPALPALWKALDVWDLDLIDALTRVLGNLGPGAMPDLVKALGLGGGNAREASARALGMMGPDAAGAAPPLVQALGDREDYVRAAAEEALGRLGPKACSALRQGFASPERRLACVRALGRIGVPALPALRQALGHSDPSVRIAAAGQIAPLSPEDRGRVVLVLAQALANPSLKEMKRAAARLLGRIGHEAAQAVPALVQTLKAEDPHLRFAAAEALGKIGPCAHAACPALAAMKDDPVQWVRPAARQAIQRIKDRR